MVGSKEDPRIKLQKSPFEGGFRPENHGICSFMLSHREYATPVWQNKKQNSREKCRAKGKGKEEGEEDKGKRKG